MISFWLFRSTMMLAIITLIKNEIKTLTVLWHFQISFHWSATCTLCATDLDKRSQMIIYSSHFSPFWGSWGSCGLWLKPHTDVLTFNQDKHVANPYGTVKLGCNDHVYNEFTFITNRKLPQFRSQSYNVDMNIHKYK